MNDQTESFGPTDEPSPSDVRRKAERAGQRVGAQVGHFAEKAGARFDWAVDQIGEKAQSVKQSFQSLTDEGWEGMKKKAVDYTRVTCECSFVGHRYGHFGGSGHAKSEVGTMLRGSVGLGAILLRGFGNDGALAAN